MGGGRGDSEGGPRSLLEKVVLLDRREGGIRRERNWWGACDHSRVWGGAHLEEPADYGEDDDGGDGDNDAMNPHISATCNIPTWEAMDLTSSMR